MNAVLRKMTASDAVAVFLRAAEGMDPKIASAFIAAIEQIRTRVPAEQIARMIERRDFVSLENAFSGHFSSTEWQPYGAAVEQAVLAGVKATSDTQGVVNGAQEDFQIAVGLNPRLEQFAITLTSTRIREIDQTTRDTIRQVLQRGLTAGDDPFAIARQIRSSIGLTRRQEAAVSNYERMLRALDPEALDRKLRDRRSDGTVERAIRADKELTEAQIRSLVDRYRDRYVKYRANVIARTESIRAVQGAQWELFQDMINKGQIDARQVRRTWIHTGDAHVRNAHLQIPSMNERGVGQNETFASPLGPILYPGDPSALAANTIQCRCAVFARIIDRGLLPSTSPGQVAPPPPPPPVAARPQPAMTDDERRRRVWANKTVDERLNVAPAFMETDPARMAIIEKLGNLTGGVTFVKSGAWHETRTLRIAMSNRDTASADYQTTMRHEYGHHIDAVIDRHLLAKEGVPQTTINAFGGYASRRALSAIAEDGKDLDKTLIETVPNGWKAKPTPGSPAAKAEVLAAREKLLNKLGLNDIEDAPAAYAKLEAEFEKRGMTLADAKKLAPGIAFLPGIQPQKDFDTLRIVEEAVKFLVSYDLKDHYTLLKELSSLKRGGQLVGLSDSIGAATLQQIGYAFGHTTSYYTKFRGWSKIANAYKIPGGPYAYQLGKRQYGVGTPAQLFANWFEAWTSGNATQYAVFSRFFPRTSKIFEELVEEALL
jgi:hypothetical protein